MQYIPNTLFSPSTSAISSVYLPTSPDPLTLYFLFRKEQVTKKRWQPAEDNTRYNMTRWKTSCLGWTWQADRKGRVPRADLRVRDYRETAYSRKEWYRNSAFVLVSFYIILFFYKLINYESGYTIEHIFAQWFIFCLYK